MKYVKLTFIALLLFACKKDCNENTNRIIEVDNIESVIIHHMGWMSKTARRIPMETVRTSGVERARLTNPKVIKELINEIIIHDNTKTDPWGIDYRVVIDIYYKDDTISSIGMGVRTFFVKDKNSYFKNNKDIRNYINQLVMDHRVWIDPGLQEFLESNKF